MGFRRREEGECGFINYLSRSGYRVEQVRRIFQARVDNGKHVVWVTVGPIDDVENKRRRRSGILQCQVVDGARRSRACGMRSRPFLVFARLPTDAQVLVRPISSTAKTMNASSRSGRQQPQ